MMGTHGWSDFQALGNDDVRIDYALLMDKVGSVFRALGTNDEQAKLIADHLVTANLKGHDSHGISLVPLYVETSLAGRLTPDAEPVIANDAGLLLNVDGKRGFGQVTAFRTMAWAIARAEQQGCVLVGLRNSHHIGRIGHYAEQCARAGLASLHFVNVVQSPAVVAPYAGRDARIHTNPIAVGVPRAHGEYPLILDFATSRVAQGKMRIAKNRNLAVPPGYLLDHEGKPSQDPGVVYRSPLGALLPFGDHKGSGLGLMCEILAGAMTGGGTMHEGNLGQELYINNAFSVVFDPARLNPEGDWQAEMEAGLDHFMASPPRDPEQPVFLPGDRERQTATKRQAEGIPVDLTTWKLVVEAAARVGIAF